MPFKPFKGINPEDSLLKYLACGLATILLLCQPALATPPLTPDTIMPGKTGQATLLIQSSPLAGSQFHALPDVVGQIRVGDLLTLQREPTNPHDANAIRVLWQGHMLGYVPRRENKAIARAMDRGQSLLARVVALRPDESPWRRLRFEISAPLTD
jgi:HIRAN domain